MVKNTQTICWQSATLWLHDLGDGFIFLLNIPQLKAKHCWGVCRWSTPEEQLTSFTKTPGSFSGAFSHFSNSLIRVFLWNVSSWFKFPNIIFSLFFSSSGISVRLIVPWMNSYKINHIRFNNSFHLVHFRKLY